MNREIKFRVWDKILGRYIPYSPILAFDNPEYVFEQFTGLKDEEGGEIYEGDIICHSFQDDKKTYNIYQAVKWEHLPAGDDMDMESLGYHINPHWRGNYKVVGNILDNPELIKKCV